MNRLETLTVPVDLGEWLQSRGLGESGAYFSTIDALYNYYWDTVRDTLVFDFISRNKKELIEVILGTRGYRVEKPLYHALIKGHELIHDYNIYWNCDKYDNDVFVSRLHPPLDNFTTELTKEEWNELGINDTNADFVKVDEELN